MIFRAAMRRRLIADSPFADVSIKASMPNRERFIPPEETEHLLEACPTPLAGYRDPGPLWRPALP